MRLWVANRFESSKAFSRSDHTVRFFSRMCTTTKAFCQYGEAVCYECLDGALSCVKCESIVCGQDDCTLRGCGGCPEQGCESCVDEHSAHCNYADGYYGYGR